MTTTEPPLAPGESRACGCCRATGDHRCGHECSACDGSGVDPDGPNCTVPHGADCGCDRPTPLTPGEPWHGEPTVILAEVRTCTGHAVTGGDLAHLRPCPVHPAANAEEANHG